MPKTFNGAIKFPSNFDVQATRPLDDRLVVDSYDDLINGSIEYPYQGMVVNIKGTSELWILKTQGIEASHQLKNWELVTGSGISEDVEQRIQEIWDRLGLAESDIDNIKEQIGDFLTSSDLDGYVKIEKLEDYIPKTELENLAKKSDLDGYVKFEDVVDFITASDLPDFLTDSDLDGYVKIEDLDGYIKTEDIADLAKKSDLDGYVRKEDIEDVRKNVEGVKEGLGILTGIVGDPGTESDEPTGIFEELDTLKKNVKTASLNNYIIPVMTPDMVKKATLDSDVDFNGSEDTHILIEDPYESAETHGDMYLNLIQNMASVINTLQTEIYRLKNSFEKGIYSYKDTSTAISGQLAQLDDVDEIEPLWAIDTLGLDLVEDNNNFKTTLDEYNYDSFEKEGHGEIVSHTDGQMTFDGCVGIFHDGKKSQDGSYDDLTLYKLNDSKLITYLVTDKTSVRMNLISLDDKTRTRTINFAPLLEGKSKANKYGFCIVVSRKVRASETADYKGFNYIYFSIIDYEKDTKLNEGYLTNNGIGLDELVDARIDINDRYSIESLEFEDLTLYRMRFYTKYEDFRDAIIPSAPTEYEDGTYVAHIAIRSVKNSEMLNTVADQLQENELIWNRENKTLHIKADDGNVYLIGSNVKPDDDNKDKDMTDKKIIEALNKMGIIINAQCDETTGEIVSLSDISLAPIADVTFVNDETKKKFTFKVDTEGNLVGKDNSAQTIEEYLNENGLNNYDVENYEAVRGFSSDYLFKKSTPPVTQLIDGVNAQSDAGKRSDRLRFSSFYAPITTDTAHGCTHSFIELENTSGVDIPLTGVYLHFFNPVENIVHHLALDGVIKAGGTYLIRGAKHAEFDDESAFIKVKTFDKEWYDNGTPVSFEQVPGTETDGKAYRFCLTYGLSELTPDTRLVKINSAADPGYPIGTKNYKKADYPNIIINPRFIDSCSFSTEASVSKKYDNNPWYANGGGVGITIKPNTMFRLMFALDPAKQAFNGFNAKDSSRVRYNKGTDIQIVSLDKEFIGYPFSKETVKIDRYTPKASFENKNVMTDKTQLNREKPNMVTCSFGVDVYNTRCFNWISCGVFDEYVWIRKEGESSWNKFQSYTKVSSMIPENHSKSIYRKEYTVDVNNTVYARMINRFPGNNVLFTSHKCVVVLPDAEDSPVKYEYVVGRPDKDGKPDSEHTNSVYTFTVYPRTYEGRTYQITDQQGFHWIEYQVWAASAEFLNKQIAAECKKINDEIDDAIEYNTTYAEDIKNNIKEARVVHTKVFPILINTGDMTQSGARINEWLDYYNGGVSLFDHLEQMNVVGNNDLCPINPRELGTGNDSDKSSSHFFHYFYCFDVRDTEKCNEEDVSTEKEPNRFIYTGEKFFTGESLIVKAHTGSAVVDGTTINININEDRYIPSTYYFKTKDVLYVMINSEIPISNVQKWFGLCSNNQYVNIYTGIEVVSSGNYAGNVDYFTPIYETMYAWLKSNQDTNNKPIRKVVVAMHEMPFTVITNTSLKNGNASQLPCTRNHPTNGNRLGSNINQLSQVEDRGIYWCSRLLEYFNCKLVIGGHKHTYALSYPIKEKYTWNGTDSKNQIKPMGPNLSDEAGVNPTNLVSWDIDLNDATERTSYNIGDVDYTTIKLNSTKTPYIPESLYNNYGKNNVRSGLFRCCTPLTVKNNDKYDGFVSYSMCQATGYKLKSNKELPSAAQVFSKIIPMTINDDPAGKGKDDASPEQLYPMYSVLEFNKDCSELTVTMNRITGIFKTNGEDKFSQSDYGKTGMTRQVLCTVEKEDCISSGLANNKPENPTNGYRYFATDENKIYIYNSTSNTWNVDNTRMYGIWLNESEAKNRADAYIADQELETPTGVSDNRYLHIKF